MGAMEDSHLFGVFVFFLTLNTIVVSLRLYLRLWLKKSAFGWDDAFLIMTYVCIPQSSCPAMYPSVGVIWKRPEVSGKAYFACITDRSRPLRHSCLDGHA